jgi:hypothetical protein
MFLGLAVAVDVGTTTDGAQSDLRRRLQHDFGEQITWTKVSIDTSTLLECMKRGCPLNIARSIRLATSF